jgi:hypothetical protein
MAMSGVFLISGCMRTYYNKPGFDKQQFDADMYQCIKENPIEPENQPISGIDKDIIKLCLAAKGYTAQDRRQ